MTTIEDFRAALFEWLRDKDLKNVTKGSMREAMAEEFDLINAAVLLREPLKARLETATAIVLNDLKKPTKPTPQSKPQARWTSRRLKDKSAQSSATIVVSGTTKKAKAAAVEYLRVKKGISKPAPAKKGKAAQVATTVRESLSSTPLEPNFLTGLPTEILLKTLGHVHEAGRSLVASVGDLRSVTKDSSVEPCPNPVFALHWDVVRVEAETTLVRVAVVDEKQRVVYDSIVHPGVALNFVSEWGTEHHGVEKSDVEARGRNIEEVIAQLNKIVLFGAIIVGHDLADFFSLCDWDIPKYLWRDTATYMKVTRDSDDVHDVIQNNASRAVKRGPHDTAEIAQGLMAVYKSTQKAWEDQIKEQGWEKFLVAVVCEGCKRRGHFKKWCPSRPRLECYYCGGEHFARYCRSSRRYDYDYNYHHHDYGYESM